MKKSILLVSLACLSLNCFGAQAGKTTGLFKALSKARQTAGRLAGQAAEAVGLKGAQKAPQAIIPKGWTPPKFTPTLKKFDATLIPAVKAGSVASSVSMTPEELNALWDTSVERPATQIAAPKIIQTSDLATYEDQGAYPSVLPEDKDEETIIAQAEEPVITQQEEMIFPFANEDVILFEQKPTPEEPLRLEKPTTVLFEQAQDFVVDQAIPVTASEQLIDTALVIVDNAQNLDTALTVRIDQSSALVVQTDVNAQTALIPLVAQPSALIIPVQEEKAVIQLAPAPSALQKVVTATATVALGAGTAAVLTAKNKPAAAKQITRSMQQQATAIRQSATPVVIQQSAAKRLTVPTPPKQTRYFNQEMFEEATRTGRKMHRNFTEELTFRAEMDKVRAQTTPAKQSTAPKTPVVKTTKPKAVPAKPAQTDTKAADLRLEQLEQTTKIKEDARLKAEADAQEAARVREQEATRIEAKAKEDTARLEREETARLKKQADDEVARLDAELKTKAQEEADAAKFKREQDAAKVEAEAQTKALAIPTAKVVKPAVKPTTLQKVPKKLFSKKPHGLKSNLVSAKKSAKPKITPQRVTAPKATLKPIAPKTLKLRPMVIPLMPHHKTQPKVKVLPKMKSYLPKLKPRAAAPVAAEAPKPAEPAPEEPKKDEVKAEEKIDDTDTASKEKKRKKTGEEDGMEEDDSDPLTKTVKRTKPTKAKEMLPEETTAEAPAPVAAPQPALPKSVATHGIVLGKTLEAWASKAHTTASTPPAALPVVTTEELNAKALRQLVVEDYRNSDPVVKSTAHHFLTDTHQAVQQAHPESGHVLPHLQPLTESAPSTGSALATTVTADDVAAKAHYPEFPNLAPKKESNAKLMLDFGKEIVNTVVVQPLKQLANYVVTTISGWFN